MAMLGDTIGITPAYAGKSADLFVKVAFEGDHPRIRGEKFR